MVNLLEAYRALAAAMDGTGDPVEFGADIYYRPEAHDPDRGGHPDAAAVVRTSGSTGTPKQTVLTTQGLRASAEATAEFIGGHAQWLVGLNLSYVAGLAMVSRSIVAGTTPVPMKPGSFTPELFVESARQLTGDFRAVSLVPTQLARLVDEPSAEAVSALRSFDAILVGGARIPDRIREASANYNVFATYGMSETCGGCVYNGVPLPGVTVDTVSSQAGDRVRITGPMVAAGYLDDPRLTDAHFGAHPDGTRWYVTDDLGRIAGNGPSSNQRLEILGRVDDVINTGGVKVSAAAVADVIEAHPAVTEALVVGIPDDQWGQLVCAAVVTTVEVEQIRSELKNQISEMLGAPAVPKIWQQYPRLPLLPNGKPDRTKLQTAF